MHAGELNRPIEFFKETHTKGDTSEWVDAEVSMGKKFVKRKDVSGNEEMEGQNIPIKVVTYEMRYDPTVLKEAANWFIRDIDGDFNVIAPPLITGPGRNRFLELKCMMRGKG